MTRTRKRFTAEIREQSQKRRYTVAKETGIDAAELCRRFVQGKGVSTESLDSPTNCLRLHVTTDDSKQKGS